MPWMPKCRALAESIGLPAARRMIRAHAARFKNCCREKSIIAEASRHPARDEVCALFLDAPRRYAVVDRFDD